MSFRRNPFQFSDFNPDDRRSEFLRRFGIQPEAEDNTMFETSPTVTGPSWAEWPGRFHRPGFHDDFDWRNTGHVFGSSGSAPGSPLSRSNVRMSPGWSRDKDDGIPIKVVHERTGSRHEDDSAESETSSQGSRSSCSSDGSSKKRYESRREPRVYHIPITVEPRDGSTSSGYASDSTADDSKQNNFKSPLNGGINNHSEGAAGEPSTSHAFRAQVNSSSPVDKPPTPIQKVNAIPVQIESTSETDPSSEPASVNDESLRTRTFPLFKGKDNAGKGSGGKPSRSASAGSSTKQTTKPQDASKISSASASNIEHSKFKPPTPPSANDPRSQIKKVLKEVGDLKTQVHVFSGHLQDKRYKYLDEMLTRCILKLDDIDTQGDPEVRQIRKTAITETQKVISMLEDKVRTVIEAENVGALVEWSSDVDIKDNCVMSNESPEDTVRSEEDNSEKDQLSQQSVKETGELSSTETSGTSGTLSTTTVTETRDDNLEEDGTAVVEATPPGANESTKL